MFNLFKTIRELLKKSTAGERAAEVRKERSNAGNGNPRNRKNKNNRPVSENAVQAVKPRKKSKKRSASSEKVDAVTPFPAPRVKPQRPEKLREIPEVAGKKRFLDFPLPEAIQFGIQNMNFEYCTPIQAQALPELLAGRDLGGKAQTGTGKTAAFLLAHRNLVQHGKSDSDLAFRT